MCIRLKYLLQNRCKRKVTDFKIRDAYKGMIKNIFEFLAYNIEEKFHKPTTLFCFVLLSIAFICAFDTLLEKGISTFWVRGVIYLTAIISVIFFWLFERGRVPPNKTGHIGIFIAIRTENNKQKDRLKNDVIAKLQDQISVHGMSQNVSVFPMSGYKIEVFSNILDDYMGLMRASEKMKTPDRRDRFHMKKIEHHLQKLGAHFCIWGKITERMKGSNTFLISTKMLISHRPLPSVIQEIFQEEVDQLWRGDIFFKEEQEFNGFKEATDLISIATRYLIGCSALFSEKLDVAYDLYKSVHQDMQKYKHHQYLGKIIKKLPRMLCEVRYESSLIAHRSGNREESRKYLQDAIRYNKLFSNLYLLQSIHRYEDNDLTGALESIKIGKEMEVECGAFLYNEGFLLMALCRFTEAIKVYKAIIKRTWDGEERFLQSVFAFNENKLRETPTYYQSHFIIGYLKYHKEGNYPAALEHMDFFLQKYDENKTCKKLKLIAMEIKKKTEEVIGVKTI